MGKKTYHIKVSASILSCDFAHMGAEVSALDSAGADYIHVDVMDGHFVPNITMGPSIIKALRCFTAKPFDVHLMIAPVEAHIQAFVEAGADIISIHPEAGPHLHRSLQSIKNLGKRAGVVLNPSTPVQMVEYVLDLVDIVLVMTVNPGFGGQNFIESQLDKIAQLRALMDRAGSIAELEVDGGINPQTARKAVEAGADVLVAGTAVFAGGAQCYEENIKRLRGF